MNGDLLDRSSQLYIVPVDKMGTHWISLHLSYGRSSLKVFRTVDDLLRVLITKLTVLALEVNTLNIATTKILTPRKWFLRMSFIFCHRPTRD
ncbi:hypothetical protein EG68_05778 [Paragonimus skrjabini miyazakii]|uniref:Uncharacterized protein n=1 Tax=Paragonimus skrjabini miyazakii TaxID=59628 RepID=A0A8S9YR65_9TREM|nr:hypothetical protein EG68_05778 [Paragonimus skrjabini miyazakii]